jgi:ABC-2 type transport system ATP-binding protein
MLVGLLEPTSGEGHVAGFDIIEQRSDIRKNIGYMSQKFSLYADMTIRENIRLYGTIYSMSEQAIAEGTDRLLGTLGLSDRADDLVGTLPLGWKQKLAFLVSMLHSPKIVFLDEPTGGVDPVTRRQFWEMIYAAAKTTTIFVTTHYMDEAEYCDRISIMVDGRIAAMGTPTELKTQFKAASVDEVFVKLARPQGAAA